MASVRSVLAFGIGAVVLLGLAIGLVSLSFGAHDTRFTPSPTKEALDWLYSIGPAFRFLIIAMLGGGGGAMAAAAVRRWKAMANRDRG